jgi:excisionase family DNA binding protein
MVDDKLVGIKEAASILAISPWTVRAWVAQGKITSAKLGARRLIPESEINRLMAEAITQRRMAKDAA